MKIISVFIVSAGILLLQAPSGCMTGSSTEGIPVVQGLDAKRYMGKWYEIALLPHSFERGMDYVSAEYTLRPDGTIRVVKSGIRNGNSKGIEGTAKLQRQCDPQDGALRVSFFPWIYSDYRIIDLAPDYSYAVVTGSRNSYLWVLSRTPELSRQKLDAILEQCRSWGFSVDRLEYPKQK